MKSILIAVACILCLIGVGCGQPVFESYGTVRGMGYGQAYQFNPYQGMYYYYNSMPYMGSPYYGNLYWFTGPDYFYWRSWT